MLIAIKKYKFHIIKTKFCRFIIKLKKLSIDLKKIKIIVNWQKPSNIIIIIIHCLTSDSDPYWAHTDYSLFTYREKTQLKKNST